MDLSQPCPLCIGTVVGAENTRVALRAERVVTFFLESGKAPEQGYKACASLMKLGERYSKERLENACGRVLAFTTTPSIRNINSILKSRLDIKPKDSAVKESLQNSNRYGITRGAAYFKKGGDHE